MNDLDRGGNYFDKYHHTRGIQRWLVRRFLSHIAKMTEHCKPLSIHEVGCGEGEISRLINQPGRLVRGSDISDEIIEYAKSLSSDSHPPIQFQQRSIFELAAPEDCADLVVCCEVLEHLDNPQRALEKLAEISRPWLILSVPSEPLWRILNVARGAYLDRCGNTPGHVQHFSPYGIKKLVRQHFEIVEARHPIPWTVLLCRLR